MDQISKMVSSWFGGNAESVSTSSSRITYLEEAKAKTGGRLALGGTSVISLARQGAVAPEMGLFICAPLKSHGKDALRTCHQTIFAKAVENNAQLLLVPAFSTTGPNCFTPTEAALIAIEEAGKFLRENGTDAPIHIMFVVYQSEDKMQCDQHNADAYQYALDHFASTFPDQIHGQLSCVKSQIQYLPGDMAVIPVGGDYQGAGAVCKAIESAATQTQLHTPITTQILPVSLEQASITAFDKPEGLSVKTATTTTTTATTTLSPQKLAVKNDIDHSPNPNLTPASKKSEVVLSISQTTGKPIYQCEFFPVGSNEFQTTEYDQVIHQKHVEAVLSKLDLELKEVNGCYAKTLYATLFDIPESGVGASRCYVLGDVDGDLARLYLTAVVSGHVVLGEKALAVLPELMNLAASCSGHGKSPRTYQKAPGIKDLLITLMSDSTYVRGCPNKLLCTGDIVTDRFTVEFELNIAAVELFKRVTDASFVGGNHDIALLPQGPFTENSVYYKREQAELKLFDLVYDDGHILALHNGFKFSQAKERKISCSFGGISFNSIEELVRKINALDLVKDFRSTDRGELRTYQANQRYTKYNPETNETLSKDILFKDRVVLHGHDGDFDLSLSHIKCLNARLEANKERTGTFAAAAVCIKYNRY